MRWLAALLVVLAWQSAIARPARPHFEADRDRFERLNPKQKKIRLPLPRPCPRTKTWSKYVSCSLKHIPKVVVVHDSPAAKLVAYQYGSPTSNKQLELHQLHDGGWVKSGFYAEVNATSELLEFAALSKEMVRVDMGYATATWVTVDDVSSRPALLRRQFAYFCSVTAGCRTVMVSCDVLVHGKAVATFRGVPKLSGNSVTLHGDGRGTNRYCVKPPNLVEAPQ